MKKTALIIQHQSSVPLGTYEHILLKSGFHLQIFCPHQEEIKGIDPAAHNLVIILGGSFGVYHTDLYPYISDEIKFLEKRIALDLPTYGVCLGSQLIAAALGAKVFPGKSGLELGWFPLTLTEEGQKSALKHFSAEHTSVYHSHGDTFDLPEGATLLASSEKYENQAYSYGKNILATQCHPEVNDHIIEEWLSQQTRSLIGKNPKADIKKIRTDTQNHLPALKTQSAKFLSDWLKTLKPSGNE